MNAPQTSSLWRGVGEVGSAGDMRWGGEGVYNWVMKGKKNVLIWPPPVGVSKKEKCPPLSYFLSWVANTQLHHSDWSQGALNFRPAWGKSLFTVGPYKWWKYDYNFFEYSSHSKILFSHSLGTNGCVIEALPQGYQTGPGHDLAGIALYPTSFLCLSRRWGRGEAGELVT